MREFVDVQVYARDINDYEEFDDSIYEQISDYVNELPASYFEDGEIPEDLCDEILSGLPVVTLFQQSAFTKAVSEWARLHGMDISEMVRGYVNAGMGSFMFMHGIGYAWLDADVLGGNGSNETRKAFDEWTIDTYGIEFVIAY